MRASLLRTIPWLAIAAATAAFVAPGCGVTGDDLFGGTSATSSAASGSGGDTGVGASGNGGATSGTGAGSGAAPDTGPGPGPGPGVGGQGGEATAGPGAGGAPNGPDASAGGMGGNGSGPPPDQLIACGGSECVVGQESCCWDKNQWNAPPFAECVTGDVFGDNCNTDYLFFEAGAETRIECQLPEHCPGQVCCGHRHEYDNGPGPSFTYYDITTCEDSCGGGNRILCDPNAPDTCPDGTSCNESTLLPPGYHVCSTN